MPATAPVIFSFEKAIIVMSLPAVMFMPLARYACVLPLNTITPIAAPTAAVPAPFIELPASSTKLSDNA